MSKWRRKEEEEGGISQYISLFTIHLPGINNTPRNDKWYEWSNEKKTPNEIHLLLSFHFYARFITSAILPRENGIRQKHIELNWTIRWFKIEPNNMHYIQYEITGRISDKIAIITITAPKSLEFDLSEEKRVSLNHKIACSSLHKKGNKSYTKLRMKKRKKNPTWK